MVPSFLHFRQRMHRARKRLLRRPNRLCHKVQKEEALPIQARNCALTELGHFQKCTKLLISAARSNNLFDIIMFLVLNMVNQKGLAENIVQALSKDSWRPGDATEIYASIGKAEKELGLK